ncbi:bone morphogenetic protein receptor type-2 isoform X2 [Neocloeon triangulifer]|uniref:bone morphogenetic protein receptor type-2 isoform X2 n=1 Tax=Neocloeon triangulifer TaxID=2078957 RepID=UPI00286EFC7F|nr:bone morphogenetic protein receptor type-2 isoform X2 [Neocloeon triangulifer]
MATTITTVFLLALFVCKAALGHDEPLQCAFRNTTSQFTNSSSLEVPESGTITCPNEKESQFCFTLWTENEDGNQIIISQGCWEMSGQRECETSNCTAHQKKASTLFCCCYGNLCNVNLTNGYVPPPTIIADDPPLGLAPSTPEQLKGHVKMILDVAIATGAILIVILVVAILASLIRKKDPMSGSTADPNAMENGSETSSFIGYSAEHLKLIEVIGQGRYGCVWRATLRDKEVAVKIFPGHYRNFFINERDIYSLSFMEHPALLTYFGCDERPGPEGGTELMLVLSYAPLGCLQDYLRKSSIDWTTFCRMSSAIAGGLAHLHTEFYKLEDGSSKPCVSHRDLNTRNILVKPDLSCCICDLGLAMKICGSKYYSNEGEQRAETKSLNDVGTLRYMAPEVLEGAVNLRDCESSLKQIDVYALGLVLWELSTRCADLYAPGLETPPYKLPFELEIGLRPSFEDMQVLVSRRKSRPLLPDKWRDSQCVRLLRETIEDCWDQDAEARLTALCVEERLKELPIIWERLKGGNLFQSGISPTVNLPTQTTATINNNNNNNVSTVENNNSNNVLLDNRLNLTFPDLDDLRTVRRNTLDKDLPGSTVSEGTVETIVTLSPSDPPPVISDPTCKNALMASTQPVLPSALQPYQGRNPCLERNLMVMEPAPQLLQNGIKVMDLDSATTDDSANESHALLSHDSLQHTPNTAIRPATPIPYLQNAVSDSGGERGCPKQSNVPISGRGLASHSSSRWSRLFGGGLRVKLFSSDTNRKQQNSERGNSLLLKDVPSGSNAVEEKTSNLSKVATRVSLQQGTPVCRKDGSPSPPRPSSLNLGSASNWLVPPSAYIKTPRSGTDNSGRFSLYENNLSAASGPENRATSVPDLNC